LIVYINFEIYSLFLAFRCDCSINRENVKIRLFAEIARLLDDGV